MSSWVHGEKSLIPRKNGRTLVVRTQCKLGRHTILQGDPAVWLKFPMGLSCFDCARRVDPKAVLEEEARLAAPKRQVRTPRPRKVQPAKPAVPKARTPKVREIKHGTKWAYDNHKCRCTPCREYNSWQRWDRKKRAKARAAELAGAEVQA